MYTLNQTITIYKIKEILKDHCKFQKNVMLEEL